MIPKVIVHGGAGGIAPENRDAARDGCRRAVQAGLDRLAHGGAAIDAAQAAVRVLEDDPSFNAGVGAVLCRDGSVELDASIMEGATLRFGAVAAVPNLLRPIELARAVLDDGEHVLLCGPGAWVFGRERGIEPCDPEHLVTPRARQRLATEAATRASGGRPMEDLGTVGAVVIDAQGRLAAATSTGGMTFKRPGRIGDTPLCGCGTYADDAAGGASATGHGESLIRATTALACVLAMRDGLHAHDAAWRAIDELAARVGGSGGIICIDREGNFGSAHNTESMVWGTGDLAGNAAAHVAAERHRGAV